MRSLITKRNTTFSLPLFLPVYQPRQPLVPINEFRNTFEAEGCIVNAFFLYKTRTVREQFQAGLLLRDYLNFDGLLVTDSGAFQGFSGPLYLDNRKIIAFQDMIQTDISSPLDLISTPGEKRSIVEKKWGVTFRRISEMINTVEYSILAGVQQGGRFLDMRQQCVEQLMSIGIKYLAIGSLVPFFNKRHDLGFIGKVIRGARTIIGDSIPMHVYGAGDPVELPFMAALGADIFDSASYGHYAQTGWFMTPYGAFKKETCITPHDFCCPCPFCSEHGSEIFSDQNRLAAHNLWTIVATVKKVRELMNSDELSLYLERILSIHMKYFPESLLQASWESLTP